jgi:hypothetical protein
MSTINFNDKIFAQEGLEAFVAELSPISRFSHSYNGEAAKIGDAIYIPRVDALVATTFAGYSDSTFPYETSGGTINTITLNVDTHFITTVDLNDRQVLESSAAELGTFARQQAKQLSKQVWQRIASIFTTVNFGAALLNISIANYGYTAGASIRTAMIKRDVPTENLSLIVNADVGDSMLKDPIIYPHYSFNGDVAKKGVVPQVSGMPVYVTNVLPTNGISLVGVVAHPDSIAVACRYLAPLASSEYLDARRVVDDETGLVLGYRRHYNPGRGKMYVSFEALFGFAVGLSLGLGILTRTN